MPEWTDKAWERQAGESEKAFEAFTVYRDMGEERTFTAVCRKLGKSRTLIDRWNKRWNWRERARAYDNDMERAARAKAVKDRQAMTERHIGIAALLQKKAVEALKALESDDLSSREIREYIKLGTDLERLNRELPEDAKEEIIYRMETEDMDEIERDIYGNG